MINGFGIGTDHFGGFSEKASVRHEWIMPLPEGLTYLDAAKIGTAGYTAMLCVDAITQGKLLVGNSRRAFFRKRGVSEDLTLLCSFTFGGRKKPNEKAAK